MASIADDSASSVPLAKLAQLRETLLREPEAINATETQEASGAATLERRDASTQDAMPLVAEAANVYHTPRTAPRFPTSKSASAVEMEAMVNPSPSQEAFVTMTRASSFHGYPGGDTQLLESQVYKDFDASIVKPTTTPEKPVLAFQDGKEDTYDTMATEKTARTCEEGDTGYIDLEQALSPAAQSVLSQFDDFQPSQESDLSVRDEEFARPALPETPHVAGRKRSRSGELLTSATTAPKQTGFSQLFGGGQNGPMMSTTQLFNQTQAPSSPVHEGPRSDPVITRPSPNLHSQFDVSSPRMSLSSPTATGRPATAGEPRDNYRSMRESQQRRAASLQAEVVPTSDIDDDMFHEEGPVEREFENKRMHRVLSDRALQGLARFSSTSRRASRLASSPRMQNTIDLVTPSTTKKGVTTDFEVSDDDNDVHDVDVIMEDETLGEDQNSSDEYDELGQEVLRSQGPEEEEEEEEEEQEGDRDEMDVVKDQDEDQSEAIREEVSASYEGALQHECREDGRDDTSAPQPTQQSAIADSQPAPQRQDRSLLPQTAEESSSVPSYIPGSQYAGRTSEEQAKNPTAPASNLGGAVTSSTDQSAGRILSSPPIDAISSAVAETTVVASSVPNQKIAEFQAHIGKEQEIPESDLPEVTVQANDSSRSNTTNDRIQDNSNNAAFFSTAQTHLSQTSALAKNTGAIASPIKIFASQQSKVASQSPMTKAGVRRFADMSAAQSTPEGSGQTQRDIDAIMSDVITADDQQFMEAVSSPPQSRPQKRRKLTRTRALEASPTSKNGETHRPETLGLENGEQQMNTEDLNNQVRVSDDAGIVPESSSFSQDNEQQMESPNGTPESVLKREQAGAKAVSQLLSKRAAKTKTYTRKGPKNTRPTKTTGSVSEPIIVQQSEQQSTNRANPKTLRKPKSTTIEDASAFTGSNRKDTAQKGDNDRDIAVVDPAEAEQSAIIAPNRIFALFKGQYNNFYPATWLGSSADGLTHHIRFDDTTPASIDSHQVRRLDLRIGDQVKVDKNGMRSKGWIVHSFGGIPNVSGQSVVGTDIYGHVTIRVQAKAGRTSLPSSTAVGEGEVVDVAVTSLYLTHTMWPYFKDRVFNAPVATASTNSRAATPSTGVRTPNSESPSRSRRAVVPTAKAVATRISHLREEAVSSPATPSAVGLFSGMAFALSYGSNESEKAEVTRLIQRNGGIILESGFDELFDVPSLDEKSPTSPSKKSPGKKGELQQSEVVGLQLKPAYESFGFVALIADRHSRRAKYVQALALGLPTLSGRWITDSLEVSQNAKLSGTNASPLSWPKYLLPAGESTYLGGAVRSRTMSTYPLKDVMLSDTIKNRGLLLYGDGVLIFAPKKGKGAWERFKTYAFLTLALGAARVKRVTDLAEAKVLCADDAGTWKWIYVDGSVTEASATLFGKGAGGSKKRKRGEETERADANAMSAGDGSVKIVNDEFVIQSLILGDLVD